MKTDVEIQSDVMEELQWTSLLNACEIGVAVKNGVVTLSGTVDSYRKKVAAEEAAKGVAGVKAVAEDIEVKVKDAWIKNDAELAEAVLNALKWNSSVREEKIKVKVENGWVTLEGEAEWEFQRSSAKTAVRNLLGVRGITNNIKVNPSVDAVDVRRKINAALHRSASLDAQKIDLEVAGRTVILRGKVRSYAEKNDAENAVWNAPGVSQVENKLEIDPDIFVLY